MPLGLLSVFRSVFSYLWSPICGLRCVVCAVYSAMRSTMCVLLCVFCERGAARARLTAVAHAATMNAEAVLSGDVGALDAIVDAFYGHDATQVRHSDDDAMRWDGLGWDGCDRATERPNDHVLGWM